MEIQIAFKEPLNYEFVAGHSKSAAQLLSGVPSLLMFEGGITNKSLVQMRRLEPLNTQDVYGYITTLAICTYPIDLVPTLSMDVKLPNSRLYQNTEVLLFNISQQINSAIGIYLGDSAAGSSSVGSSGGNSDDGTSKTGGNGGDVFQNTSGDSTSSSTKAKVAGIAIGAAALAGAYGGLMFFIARKYKRRQMARSRASSLSNPDSMHRGSPAMMGGALMSQDFTNYGAVSGGGRDSHGSHGSSNQASVNQASVNQASGRTAYISAPVAAENSLGWN